MVKVLDASALLVYLEKQPGYEKIKELFVRVTGDKESLLMSAINWGEVFYILVRYYGLDKAEEIQQVIETFPLELVSIDIGLAKQAALYKALKKLPYVDCFAAALAKIHDGELITCDKEFGLVADEIKVIFL